MDSKKQILEFANKHLGQYKIKGNEIVVKKCPYCGKEKEKFSINTEKGLFQCFSGSCRETGHISKLYFKFGEKSNLSFNPKKVDLSDYVKNISKETIEFLKKRGITEKTIKQNVFDIMSTKNNEISFIYRKGFDIHFIKCRNLNDKKFNAKKIKELTLWKLDFCDEEKPLIICEGELDALSFEEQGIENVVSVPAGVSSLGWLETDYDTLEKYKEIIIAFDNDKAGEEGTQKLAKRLPADVSIKILDYGMFKDANEVHLAGEELKILIENAIETDDEMFVKMKELDISEPVKRFSTGSLYLNRAIGGIRTGEVNIWTGIPGCGKSSILNQIMLNVLEQGNKGLVYSPELPDKQYKRWTCCQLLKDAKGSFNKYYDKILKQDVFYVKKEIADKMSAWLDKQLRYITGEKSLTDKELLRIIVKEIKRNDVKFIVIDNLMKVIFENLINLYEQQKDFLNELSKISKKYNVSINLVAHPKKHNKDEPDQFDIAGTSNIPNLVDNIFYFRRITKRCIESDNWKRKADHFEEHNISTLIIALKSREGEKIGSWLEFNFDVVRKSINHYLERPNYLQEWNTKQNEQEIIFNEEDIW
jgi:twinkle protein